MKQKTFTLPKKNGNSPVEINYGKALIAQKDAWVFRRRLLLEKLLGNKPQAKNSEKPKKEDS